MLLRPIRLPALLVSCAMLVAGCCAFGAGPAVAGGVKPCFSEIPPLSGNPQWGFHTGPPISGRNGSYARALGDVTLSTGSISGTVCQVNVVAGVDHLIVLKPQHVISHTHTAMLFGHLGNLMEVDVKITSSTDKKCKVGTIGHMTVDATYNGVHSSSVRFTFPASCKGHDHLYHSSQVDALVPES
jgi:hypothetical protein